MAACPLYYPGGSTRFDLAVGANGLVNLRFLVTYYLTCPACVFFFVDDVWSGLAKSFGLPPWWIHLFGPQNTSQTLAERWTCFFLHSGDMLLLLGVVALAALVLRPVTRAL